MAEARRRASRCRFIDRLQEAAPAAGRSRRRAGGYAGGTAARRPPICTPLSAALPRRRRRCSAKGQRMPDACSSASSRVIRRIWPAGRLSGRPARFSTRLSTQARHRPACALRHQCGEAFQIRAARQAAHPPEAEYGRGAALPLVADAGTGSGKAETDRGHGRHGARLR